MCASVRGVYKVIPDQDSRKGFGVFCVEEPCRSRLVLSRGFCENEQQECHIRTDEQAESEGHSANANEESGIHSAVITKIAKARSMTGMIMGHDITH
jgi:hypothetical protein